MTINLETREGPDNDKELLDEQEIVTSGQLLHDARIARGLTIKNVSDNINLKLSVIENIEKDVDDDDISHIFMRGYIRCYARYLKLSEADVLSAYDSKNTDPAQQTELQSFSRRTKKEANDSRLMLASYAILGCMFVGFLIWGFQRDDVNVVVPEPAAELAESIQASSPDTKSDNNISETPLAQVENVSNNVEAIPADKSEMIATDKIETTATDKTEAVPSKVKSAVIIAKTTITPIEVENKTAQVKDNIVESNTVVESNTDKKDIEKIEEQVVTLMPTVPASTDVAVSEPVLAEPVKPEPVEVIKALVELTFAGDCWVEIKNSEGKTLVTGVKKAGQTLQLEGVAPLSVKLGAPEQVSMRFAGEDIDLSHFRKSRLAKFKLPFKA